MAVLTAAFRIALQERSTRTASILREDFPRVIDALTELIENVDLVCRSCGHLGVLTSNRDPLHDHLTEWIAHIECPNGEHDFMSEGHAPLLTTAIKRAKKHWSKYS